MQSIKINGSDIEIENGTIEVQDGGKKIIFRGDPKPAEHHWHYAPLQVYPYQPFTYPITTLPYGPPIVTCSGLDSTNCTYTIGEGLQAN